MAYCIPNEGEQHILSGALMTGAAAATALLRLFSNNVTLTATMMASSLTVLTAGGYKDLGIPISCWAVPWVSAGSATTSASASNGLDAAGGFKFTCSAVANQSAYGYWIQSTTGKAIVVETFSDGPYYLGNAGDSITVTPYIKLGSGTNN